MDKRVKLTLRIRQQLIVLLLSSSLWAQDNQLAEAERGYRDLLGMVQNPRAVDETEWRLASV